MFKNKKIFFLGLVFLVVLLLFSNNVFANTDITYIDNGVEYYASSPDFTFGSCVILKNDSCVYLLGFNEYYNELYFDNVETKNDYGSSYSLRVYASDKTHSLGYSIFDITDNSFEFSEQIENDGVLDNGYEFLTDLNNPHLLYCNCNVYACFRMDYDIPDYFNISEGIYDNSFNPISDNVENNDTNVVSALNHINTTLISSIKPLHIVSIISIVLGTCITLFIIWFGIRKLVSSIVKALRGKLSL